MTARTFGVVGAPTSAGARTPGIEQAPQALRDAGFSELLRAAGHEVHDHGDLPVERWRPDPAQRAAQNAARVAVVAGGVAERVADVLGRGRLPLVLGGDCTVTVGAVAGWVRHRRDVGLLYVDGGLDLTTPATSTEQGHMDAMGVAHLIGEPGCADALTGVGPRVPLLAPGDVVFAGIWQGPDDDPEEQVRQRHSMVAYTVDEIRGRAPAAGEELRAGLDARERPFLVHLDVDVIDHLDLPIADIPADHDALSLADTMALVSTVARSRWFGGLVVTEVNPDHTTPETGGVARLVRALAEALAPAA